MTAEVATDAAVVPPKRFGHSAEVVPPARLSGPIPWVIAIMVALMVIAAAGGLALRNTGKAAAADLSGGITVQIVEARPAERERQAGAAVTALGRIQGVSEVRLVPQAELDALLEPWLTDTAARQGDAAADAGDAGIPVPSLIDAQVSGQLSAGRIASIQAQVRRVAPAARVDAQAAWLKPVFGAVDALQWLALALIVLLSFATGAAVMLAARTALGNNRETIEVVHLLGGTDGQIARIFQRSIGLDALGGSIAGTAAGGVVIALLGKSFAALQGGIVTGAALGWVDWLAVALIPVAAVLLAVWATRWTVMRVLRRML